MPRKTTVSQGNKHQKLPFSSGNLNEIASIRKAELSADQQINSAKISVEKMLDNARKEGAEKLENALKVYRTELGEKYRLEELKAKEDSNNIISEAKTSAETGSSKAQEKVPEAVEILIKKILESE